MVDPGEGDEQAGRRLLIADPDPRLRAEMADFCRQDGFDVVEAATGQEALTAFAESRPSAVLLEVNLPDLSGFDVCRELRRQGADVPILLVSTRPEGIVGGVGLAIGAGAHVTKPVRLCEVT